MSDALRTQKALKLVDSGHVMPVKRMRNVFCVRTQDKDKDHAYLVNLNEDEKSCTCYDYVYRASKSENSYCKHQIASKIYVKRLGEKITNRKRSLPKRPLGGI